MVDGKMKFWGGVVVESWGGGPGLFDQELRIARDHGVEVRYGARALSLLTDGHRATGVRVKPGGSIHDLRAAAVVPACGGFQSHAPWRTRHQGPGWGSAKVPGRPIHPGGGLPQGAGYGPGSLGNASRR